MEANQFEGKTLKYLAIEPDDYDSSKSYPMIILMHGFGASMRDLAGLCPAIDSKGYVYICPNAPLTVQLGPGMTGFAWAPPRDSRADGDMDSAVDMLSVLVEEVTEQYRVEKGQIILGGFSQGGMMTYAYGLPNPEQFKGLVMLSSMVFEQDKLKGNLPAERTMSIFVSHGTSDAMISLDVGQSSRDFLVAESYKPDYFEYDMGHEISQEVLDDLVPWIRNVLPPFGSG